MSGIIIRLVCNWLFVVSSIFLSIICSERIFVFLVTRLSHFFHILLILGMLEHLSTNFYSFILSIWIIHIGRNRIIRNTVGLLKANECGAHIVLHIDSWRLLIHIIILISKLWNSGSNQRLRWRGGSSTQMCITKLIFWTCGCWAQMWLSSFWIAELIRWMV